MASRRQTTGRSATKARGSGERSGARRTTRARTRAPAARGRGAGKGAAGAGRRGAPRQDVIVAVDLGSNSFHMVVARLVGGEPHVLDRLRDRVALGAGLDGRNRLSRPAQERALASLRRFGQRVKDLPPGSVRAVGTNALRQAANARGFLARARRVLGHPIEVISGREEARLIYVGVAHGLADDAGRRLVVDIGGGSTECILGERLDALLTDSLYMGCVNWTRRFFPGGDVRRGSMGEAVIAAQLELQSIERRYQALGWERCVGASGTILAVESVLRAKGWSERGITREGLRRLREHVEAHRRVARIDLPGMQPERREVFPGGLAVLIAVFESLRIERMDITPASLREGLIHDLVGRIRHEDARQRTIRVFSQRYHLDVEHAVQVERTALALLEQAAASWGLEGEEPRQLLSWAAHVHEIGLSVGFAGHHKHGAYIIAHADMPGFSREDQQVLAALVGGHRRRLRPDAFRELPAALAEPALRLCLLLRLAVCVNRARSPHGVPAGVLSAGARRVALTFPRGWLDRHPLTRADLRNEADAFRVAGVSLAVA
jgi:exopolyphosphatase/guanosine-5'-triphosphate,3'-diphosphate pyrophosphatase